MIIMSLLWILSICLAICLCLADADWTCPTLFNYYPDQFDCTRYYRCNWGKAVPFTCGAGTRWSQDLLTCDHAKNVPCSRTPAYTTYQNAHTGQLFHRYLPEVQAPDFSYDYNSNPDPQYVQQPDFLQLPSQQFPEYHVNGYPQVQYPESIFTSTYPTRKATYEVEYGKYRPHLQYHRDNHNAKYTSGHMTASSDYLYTTYTTRPTLPFYDYYTTAGYSDPTTFPKVNRGDLYPSLPEEVSTSTDVDNRYSYKKQNEDLPSWFPFFLAKQRRKSHYANQPNDHAREKSDETADSHEDPWHRSDLFRAGYGYKKIYIKK